MNNRNNNSKHFSYEQASVNLDSKKTALLSHFMEMAKDKSPDEMLPLMLAVSSKAKKEGISFSHDEISAIINTMKKDMPDEERKKIDMFMSMLNLSTYPSK